MNKQKEGSLMLDIRKELTGFVLERVYNIAYPDTSKFSTVPEKDSPMAVYETEEMLDIPYVDRVEADLVMDIIKPVVSEDHELPVIVAIHSTGVVAQERIDSRMYARSLASRGYMVFNIEYRRSPKANVYEQLEDICAGLDLVKQRLKECKADSARIFLTALSEGAFIAVYVAAMGKSEALQEAIGRESAPMTFQALGLHSGLFYMNRDDPIGCFYGDQIFGEKKLDDSFRRYLNLEHKEIIKNLPPVFLTTSRGDWLNNYTLMYHKALKKAGQKSHLLYMGDKKLEHACVGSDPNRAECIDAIDKMCSWFDEQIEQSRKDQERTEREQKAYQEILARLEDGDLIGCKSWRFIRELNSFSMDRLNSLAMVDGDREYSYRQMFAEWEKYAQVFSALGITGESGSRAAVSGRSSAAAIIAFYALNMTGASASMVTPLDLAFADRMEKVIEREGITDILVDQTLLDSKVLPELLKKKSSLGIRNIIVLPNVHSGKAAGGGKSGPARKNGRKKKEMPGVLFMDDLLHRYEGWPVSLRDGVSDNAAVIIHSSGTTKGIQKPIPLSDEAFNEAVGRFVRDERFEKLRGTAVTLHIADMSSSYGMVDGIHLPFAFGGTIVLTPASLDCQTLQKIQDYSPNIYFTAPKSIDMMMKSPMTSDLSGVEYIFCGGAYFSAESKKEFNQFLEKSGSKAKVTAGYGLSEIGAACIISDPDREDDAMGYPLSGVKVKIYDEEDGSFHDLDEGPRTGIMYLSSRSLSSGTIDDKVFFELEEIDGEKYFNSSDLVRVNEDGSLNYIGRANKYFVNNEGIRFDAGLIERAVSAEPGIEVCGMVPGYNRSLRDTFPILYVKTKDKEGRSKETVEKALSHIFINEKLYDQTNLPGQCVLTDYIPYNANGKVDVNRILSEKLTGTKYKIVSVSKDGELVDINLLPAKEDIVFEDMGVPKELEESMKQSASFNKAQQEELTAFIMELMLKEECPILKILG